jgi:hypothetical protein
MAAVLFAVFVDDQRRDGVAVHVVHRSHVAVEANLGVSVKIFKIFSQEKSGKNGAVDSKHDSCLESMNQYRNSVFQTFKPFFDNGYETVVLKGVQTINFIESI